MTIKEHGILVDAFGFLREFADPPNIQSPGCADFWEKASDRLDQLGQKWHGHPLATGVLVEIYLYIETKQKELSKR